MRSHGLHPWCRSQETPHDSSCRRPGERRQGGWRGGGRRPDALGRIHWWIARGAPGEEGCEGGSGSLLGWRKTQRTSGRRVGRTSGGPPETRRVHDALWTPRCKRPARKEYVSLGETGVKCWSVDNADRRHTLRPTEMRTGPRAEPWGRPCKDLRGRRRGDRNVPGGELQGAGASRQDVSSPPVG